VACYAWYYPYDAWWYLRFLLPAFPALFIFVAMVLVAIAGRVTRLGSFLVVAPVLALILWHHATFLSARGGFAFRENERKVPAIGEYIAAHLPENASLLSDNFSGSIRYYSGRLTVRFDLIPPDQLGQALSDLQRIGFHPYIVVNDWEQEAFRRRFAAYTPIGALDWPPVAWLQHSTRVFIYDPADRGKSQTPNPTIIH